LDSVGKIKTIHRKTLSTQRKILDVVSGVGFVSGDQQQLSDTDFTDCMVKSGIRQTV